MNNWRGDIAAALSVSFVAIPQALAYSAMAGLPPYIGLYATSIPTFVAAVFGTSRVLSTGPVAIISLLSATTLAQYSGNLGQLVIGAATLSILVGLIQLALGFLKVGSFINFIAYPVLSGFTTAAAFIIWFSQVPKLLGVTVSNQPHFYQVFVETIRNINLLHVNTAVFGLGSVLVLFILNRFLPKIPAALVVVVGTTFASYAFDYSGPIIGVIPSGLMLFNPLQIVGSNPSALITSAFIIAVVGFVSGISVVKQLSSQTRDQVNPNQELVAQGAANISSGLFGSFPVAGSLSRTALNMSAGAQSNRASMLMGIIGLFVMLFLARLLYYLPYAALAAIIMVAVANLLNIKEILSFFRTQYRDGAVAIITLVATLLFAPHLDMGIAVGIIASVIAHLHRSADPHLEIFFCHDIDYLHSHHYHLNTYPSNKKVLGVAINSSLTFANASLVSERILGEITKYTRKPKYVLLIANSIGSIDASAEQALLSLHRELIDRKITLLFAGLKPHVEEALKRTEFHDFIGGGNIYPEINLALKAINENKVKENKL